MILTESTAGANREGESEYDPRPSGPFLAAHSHSASFGKPPVGPKADSDTHETSFTLAANSVEQWKTMG